MKLAITIFAILLSSFAFSQVEVKNPVAAEISHPELRIQKITFYTDSTVFSMLVENKRTSGGWFCADKKMYIENPATHQRFKLIRSKDIPNCPNVHNFKNIGEAFVFTLTFPSISPNTRTISLIEDCQQSCFFFKNIILDSKLNLDIHTYEQGMKHYTQNEFAEAIDLFSKVIENIPAYPTHVYGYSYYHLVSIYRHLGDNTSAEYWMKQLEMAPLPDKQYFIDGLKKLEKQ